MKLQYVTKQQIYVIVILYKSSVSVKWSSPVIQSSKYRYPWYCCFVYFILTYIASSMSEPQADVVLTLLQVIAPDRIPMKNLVEALRHSRKRLEASVKFAKLVMYVLESFSQKVCTVRVIVVFV